MIRLIPEGTADSLFHNELVCFNKTLNHHDMF